MANQKLGMATPTWVAPMMVTSVAELRLTAASTPTGKAISVDRAKA